MMQTAIREIPTPPAALAEIIGPMTALEANLEANRCLYCFDAPCAQACPTHIDIPGFIRKIAQDRPTDAAKAILASNLLGATCSRVCPVQELCEGACVMGVSVKPIAIGRLQRFAMDAARGKEKRLIPLAKPTGKRVAVVGSGPAGLSCAGELAKCGHQVEIFEKRDLPGGLSTYGIVSLREPGEVALAEVKMIEELGVSLHLGQELGVDFSLEQLEEKFDAVFLAVGLGRVPLLQIEGSQSIVDGLQLVEDAKLNPETTAVGNDVVVIGAGNTAIDCATIAKRLGAKNVTIVYRRTSSEMTAYEQEFEFAKVEGINFRFLANPIRVEHQAGKVTALICQNMRLGKPDASGRPSPEPIMGDEFAIAADMVVAAIGQDKPEQGVFADFAHSKGFLAVDSHFQTNRKAIFAGGDAIRATGAASTVMAVQDGKMAARSINDFLEKGDFHG